MDPARDATQATDSAVTWYCYLLLGYFTYLVSIQGSILPFLREDLALSYRTVSLHTSAFAVGVIAVGLGGERAVRRFGRRRMLAAAVVGSASAMVLLTRASATWASLGSTFLFGLIGPFIPAMVPAILSDVHGPRRDVAYAEANAVAYAFASMAPVLTGLCAWIGWNWRLAVLAGAASGIVIVLAFAGRPVPASLEAPGGSSAPLPPAFWWYWAQLGFSVAVEFSILLWAPAYLEAAVGLAPGAAALAAAAFFAGMLAGRVGGSWLFRFVATRPLFLWAAAVTVVGFAGYWAPSAPLVAVPGLFVVGLGVALLFPLALSLAMGAAGPAADRASTRTMLAPGLAILLSPPLLGAIADTAGLRLAQLATPAFMILAVLAFLAGERARRARPG